MTSLRALALRLTRFSVFASVFASLLAGAAGACNSSSTAPAPPDGGSFDDAALADAPLGPFFCDLPVPATCPMTAPCSFETWGCPAVACDGYLVVTDGTWTYYYSANGGALTGEVPAADAAFVACPYAFQPPAGCAPAIAAECALEGGAQDGAVQEGGAQDGSARDGSTPDAAALAEGGTPSDAGADDGAAALDGPSGTDTGSASDGGTGADGS